jgi:hypothetical protein
LRQVSHITGQSYVPSGSAEPREPSFVRIA